MNEERPITKPGDEPDCDFWDLDPGLPMRYASICSGIEAPSVAWAPIGWKPVFFAETAAFPCAVLAHHYPETPNLGDVNDWRSWPDADVDVLVAGTPCQSFSVAGMRAGLADPRGNLALVMLAVVERFRPRWLVWENVPGVLSIDGGRAFGAVLGGLAELGYGFAYRVLDAQYFGVPQRRRRVFVVGYSGGLWQRAAAVLFERASLSGHPAPRREVEQDVTGTLVARTQAGGGLGTDLDCAGGLVAHSEDGTGRGVPLVANTARMHKGVNSTLDEDEGQSLVSDPVTAREAQTYSHAGNNAGRTHNLYADRGGVRRLTPLECELLQGFPTCWTMIRYRNKPATDGPRYRALGNSMAVPVVRWIGERIAKEKP